MVFITIEEIETIKGCLLSPHVYELVVTVIKVAMYNYSTCLHMLFNPCVLTFKHVKQVDKLVIFLNQTTTYRKLPVKLHKFVE